MLPTYQKLEKEGKIGPFFKNENNQLMARPFVEYPKMVKLKLPGGGVLKKACKTQQEELAFKMSRLDAEDGPKSDPLIVENARLAQENAANAQRLTMMEAELGRLRSAASTVNSSAMSAANQGAIQQNTGAADLIKPTTSLADLLKPAT